MKSGLFPFSRFSQLGNVGDVSRLTMKSRGIFSRCRKRACEKFLRNTGNALLNRRVLSRLESRENGTEASGSVARAINPRNYANLP